MPDKKRQQWSADLSEWVKENRAYSKEGKCATYIPALANANPLELGVCLLGPDGTLLKAGDWEKNFTLQSISKVISFILACMHQGVSHVLERVDVEPTGDAFNSIIRLEVHKPGKPFNPMINAGAITVSSLLPGDTVDEKVDGLLQFVGDLIGKRPKFNEEVFKSEWETANRNRALAYYLKETGYLDGEVENVLEVYLKQCSIEVNASDLAHIGLVISQDGYDPINQKQVFQKDIAKITKALMLTCGMYNASGKFAAFIGVPAKSGVSGGILGTVPFRDKDKDVPFKKGCGIGIYGPAIDDVGNSMAGKMLLKQIANEWEFNIF